MDTIKQTPGAWELEGLEWAEAGGRGRECVWQGENGQGSCGTWALFPRDRKDTVARTQGECHCLETVEGNFLLEGEGQIA